MLPLLAVGNGIGVVEAAVSSRVPVPEGRDLEAADEDVLLSRRRVWAWSPSISLLEGMEGPMNSPRTLPLPKERRAEIIAFTLLPFGRDGGGIEWTGVEWSAMGWMAWGGLEWNGVGWSGVEWNGVE